MPEAGDGRSWEKAPLPPSCCLSIITVALAAVRRPLLSQSVTLCGQACSTQCVTATLKVRMGGSGARRGQTGHRRGHESSEEQGQLF